MRWRRAATALPFQAMAGAVPIAETCPDGASSSGLPELKITASIAALVIFALHVTRQDDQIGQPRLFQHDVAQGTSRFTPISGHLAGDGLVAPRCRIGAMLPR